MFYEIEGSKRHATSQRQGQGYAQDSKQRRHRILLYGEVHGVWVDGVHVWDGCKRGVIVLRG